MRETESVVQLMKVKIKSWHAIAQWQWDTGNADHDEGDGEGDVCGICRVPYEGCCPTCKVPGDDCPLSELQKVHLLSPSLRIAQYGANVVMYSICIVS